MKTLLLLSFIVFLLVACSQPSSPAATFTQTVSPTEEIIQTSTLTPTFTDQHPFHSPQTATPPQFIPYNAFEQATIDAINNSGESFDALFTKVYSFPHHCLPDHVYDSSFSPDGNWSIYPCQSPSNTRLEVSRFDGTSIWSITDAQVLSAMPWMTPWYDFGHFHWSKDSQDVYFSITICCGDRAPDVPHLGYYAGPLIRMNVQTGDWNIVYNPPIDSSIPWNPDAYTYSFSPTDRRLIIMFSDGSQTLFISIIDLQTGATETISIPGSYDGGSVVWSPDGLSFALTALHGNESFTEYSFSVFLYHIDSKSLQKILTSSSNLCVPIKWSEDSLLTLSCQEYAPDFASIIRQYLETYDVSNGGLIPSPTP